MLPAIKKIKRVNEQTNKKPLSVSVIGWVFIAFGIQMILLSLVFFIFNSQFDIFFQDEIFNEHIFIFDLIITLYKNYIIFSMIILLLGAACLISGINFLKLKKWARLAIEKICTFLFIFVLVFSFYWIFMWINFSGSFLNDTNLNWSMLKLTAIFIGVFSLLVYGGLLWVIIRLARSDMIRSLMTK